MKILLTCVLIWCIALANAQKPVAYFQAKGDNILYSGVNHRIEVISNVTVDSVTTSKGTLTSAGAPNSYFIFNNEAWAITCIIRAWKKGKVIAEKEYRVQILPAPTGFFIGQKNGGKLSVARAKVGMGLNMIIENTGFDITIRVKQFKVMRIGKDGSRQEEENTGAAFLTETKALIEKAQAGDFYLFREIIAIMPNGGEVYVNAFFIEITE